MAALIRLADVSDGSAIAAIYRSAVTDSATSFELEPPDGAEMGRRIVRVSGRTPWLVCEAAEDIVGYAYASPHRERAAYQWSVEVSAYIRRDARRMGVARALYTSLFAALVVQGFHNAYAGVTLPNAASEGLHRSMGFSSVGVYHAVGYKRGAWHDVAWFEYALAPHAADPPPPEPLPAVAGSVAFQHALARGTSVLRLPAA